MQYDGITTNPLWQMDTILKIVFGYIAANYCPIDAKFGRKKQNLVQIQVA